MMFSVCGPLISRGYDVLGFLKYYLSWDEERSPGFDAWIGLIVIIYIMFRYVSFGALETFDKFAIVAILVGYTIDMLREVRVRWVEYQKLRHEFVDE